MGKIDWEKEANKAVKANLNNHISNKRDEENVVYQTGDILVTTSGETVVCVEDYAKTTKVVYQDWMIATEVKRTLKPTGKHVETFEELERFLTGMNIETNSVGV